MRALLVLVALATPAFASMPPTPQIECGPASWSAMTACFRSPGVAFRVVAEAPKARAVHFVGLRNEDHPTYEIGTYLYIELDGKWVLADFYQDQADYEVASLRTVPSGGYLMTIRRSQEYYVQPDGHTNVPGIKRETLAFYCGPVGACRLASTACEVTARGKVHGAFRGHPVIEAGKLRVELDRGEDGTHCTSRVHATWSGKGSEETR